MRLVFATVTTALITAMGLGAAAVALLVAHLHAPLLSPCAQLPAAARSHRQPAHPPRNQR